MIIVKNKQFLQDLCDDRGYDIEDVMPCVIAIEGENWTIDTSSPYFPKRRPYVIIFGAQ